MENEANKMGFEEGQVLIEIVKKTVEDREGVDVQFKVDTMDMGTLFDLGQYFTNLARNQMVRTRPPEEDITQGNSQEKQRVRKPAPKR